MTDFINNWKILWKFRYCTHSFHKLFLSNSFGLIHCSTDIGSHFHHQSRHLLVLKCKKLLLYKPYIWKDFQSIVLSYCLATMIKKLSNLPIINNWSFKWVAACSNIEVSLFIALKGNEDYFLNRTSTKIIYLITLAISSTYH